MTDNGFELHMTPAEFQKYMEQHNFFAVEYRGDRQEFFEEGSSSPASVLVRANFDFMYIVGNEIRLHCVNREVEMVLRDVREVILAYMFENPLLYIECGDSETAVGYDFIMKTDDELVGEYAPYDEEVSTVSVSR